MKPFRLLSLVLLTCSAWLLPTTNALGQTPSPQEFKTVTFESLDGLDVTADLYAINAAEKPFIVMCHQAGWSRGEYREIAPKLNQIGFNCLAIDQRSGQQDLYNKVGNVTHQAAVVADRATEFVDAEQDIIAALKWARANHAKGKVLLWGSSYSAALSLRIAGENPDLVDGVLAFAPGEYFKRFNKPGNWIETSAKKIAVPAFITSAKNEYNGWKKIYDAIPNQEKSKFVPTTPGNHGSRALFERFEDSQAYWAAVAKFLEPYSN